MKLRKSMVSTVIFLLLVQGFTGCAKTNDEKRNTSNYETKPQDRYDAGEAEYPMADEETAKADFSTSAATKEYWAEDGYEPQKDAWNTEEYNAVEESSYYDAMKNPLTTFAADVDTASYSNVRRMILDGAYIDPGAVRIEEMINYFEYEYEEPSDNEPFAVTTEVSECPWIPEHQLLSIGVQAQKLDLEQLPPSNLVFLLDVSGSIYDADKLPLVIQAFTMLTEQLTEKDRISIVTYAGDDAIVLEGVQGHKKSIIINALNHLMAGGSTNGAEGINSAYRLAEKYFIHGGNNRIILATDGDLNVGITSESDLKALIEEKRETGIYLSVLGFGTGNIKDNKMETLADYGNGNYAYIDQLAEAKKVLVEEMSGTIYTLAKDVKFQIEFNPAVVVEYRQIGYENRAMANEDFDDDTKDAGEIGAGHRVTVLYELKLNGNYPATEKGLKYQNVKLSDSSDYATVKIRYKRPNGNERTQNVEFNLCSAFFFLILLSWVCIYYRNKRGGITYNIIIVNSV